MAEAGLIVLASFVSPFRADREMARALFAPGEFLEVFVDTPIELCEQRDVKGLYRKAREGQLPNFTGISSPYEPPESPDIWLRTEGKAVDVIVSEMLEELARLGLTRSPTLMN
jgi:bifunctional enzyme CysN/CysC